MRSLTVAWGVAGLIIMAALGMLLIPDVVKWSVTAVFYTAVIGFGVATATVLAYSAWAGIERILLARAQRHKLEHEADVMAITAPGDHRAWLHMRDGTVYNLSMDSRWMVEAAPDGHQPTEAESRAWLLYHQLRNVPRLVGRDGVQMLPEPEERPVDVLSVVRQHGCYLVVGAQNSGKTTLLRWFAEDRLRLGWKVAVVDPHSPPGDWPPGCEVIGTGRNFEAVGLALRRLLELMDRRYKQVGRGEAVENSHPGIAFIIDEYLTIYEHDRGVSGVLISLLTESRKVNINLAVGSHSRRVRSLGLDGKGDLLEGLRVIQLVRHRDGRREALVEDQDGQMSAYLPGEYEVLPPSNGGDNDLALLTRPEEPSELVPGSDEARIIQMYLEDESLRAITQSVFGRGKFGAHWNEKVYEVLDRYGVPRRESK